MRDAALPAFAAVLGAAGAPVPPLARALGLVFAAACVLALQSALGLVFDPRYRDFPFAALTAMALPCLLAAAAARGKQAAGTAERIAAGTLALSALYVVPNEGLANWQALWSAAAFAALVIALLLPRAARS